MSSLSESEIAKALDPHYRALASSALRKQCHGRMPSLQRLILLHDSLIAVDEHALVSYHERMIALADKSEEPQTDWD